MEKETGLKVLQDPLQKSPMSETARTVASGCTEHPAPRHLLYSSGISISPYCIGTNAFLLAHISHWEFGNTSWEVDIFTFSLLRQAGALTISVIHRITGLLGVHSS